VIAIEHLDAAQRRAFAIAARIELYRRRHPNDGTGRLATSKFVAIILGTWLWGAYAMTTDGLTTIPSSFGPKETMDRLEAEIKAKGMTVFARIDHAAGAAELGLPLRPTELLLFGSAKAGTPLMQANQAIGIDLPLKALVFENAAGKIWLSYNDPRWLAQRHGLGAADIQTVDAMAAALNAVATKATKAP
jgi:uncharacterized protein (DUF302 family)